MQNWLLGGVAAATLMAAAATPIAAQDGRSEQMAQQDAEARAWAAHTEAQMTNEERFTLIHGIMALPMGPDAEAQRASWPEDVVAGAGYVHGIARLGIPSLRETDASLGVTNPFSVREGDTATALPGSIALGATFDPDLAYQAGHLVGAEARAKGFNVLLGGGMNLMRDPRNGRNFEYISEDPLLSGLMGGEQARGAQDAGVVSTVKHFALNSNETNRHTWDAIIADAPFRESDLLAFQIAIEIGNPGSIMCAYNLVNGHKACGSDYLLNTVLKQDWGYQGWVMSDWGAVWGADFALKGLDQQSGEQLDDEVWFDGPLQQMLADGSFSQDRLGDMVRRILYGMKVGGIIDAPPAPAVDLEAHAQAALEVAQKGIVLLKNDDVLPLVANVQSVAIIGGKAGTGVISGGGSSQGMPAGGWIDSDPVGGSGEMGGWRTIRWFPGSPQEALQQSLPETSVEFDPGIYPQSAAALAARSDVAIVFVTKYEAEGFDSPDLSLPAGQDEIVEAVARANPNTIVVMETGNPITMPWLDSVKAVVAAWYPGQEGGQAIADVLTGAVNPSGRLPITFPMSEEQLVRPTIPSFGTPPRTHVTVEFTEGADVGYRWFARHDLEPLFAFGEGLSYTDFAYSGFQVDGGDSVTAKVTVRNTGDRAGADVPQVYLQSINGEIEPRLLAFE
uniref:Beta-glucosidase n=1 Tax=uncultured microorganism TaxID=358574 RepID=W5X3L9_9ZZZZ|nr:beta-glucosidase [uncultured microorganism]